MDADKTCQATFALNPSGDLPPTASFSYSCMGLNCSFDGSTSSDDDSIGTYHWDFGENGAPVSGPTAVHTYTAAGTYSVKLTVTDNALQPNDVTVSVQVKDKGRTKGDSGGDDGGGSGNCPPAKAAKGKCY
jgi:PKD repeat protein